MWPAVQHGPLREEEDMFLQSLKMMFKVCGAALDRNITSNLTDSPLDKQRSNCGQLYWPFLLLWWKLQGVSDICTAWDQWSGYRSGLCRCLEPAEYGWWGGLLQPASLSPAPCPGLFSHLCPFSTTKTLLSVKMQLCMGHIQVVGFWYLVLSTGWTTWWLVFILFCQCCEAHHLTFPSPFLFYQLKLS